MRQTEHAYVSMGYLLEKSDANQRQALAQKIRAIIELEAKQDQAEARRLVMRGQTEAKTN